MVRFTLSLLALLAISNSVVNSASLNKRLDYLGPALIGAGGVVGAGAVKLVSDHFDARKKHKYNQELESLKHNNGLALEQHKATLQQKNDRASNRPGGQLSPFGSPNSSPASSRKNSVSSIGPSTPKKRSLLHWFNI